MSKHYPLSPSGSKIWTNCPGSLDLKRFEKESEYSKLGTEAHQLAEDILLGKEIETPSDVGGADMLRAVRVYTDHIEGLKKQLGPDLIKFAIEQTLESSTVPDLGGTIDCLMVYQERGKVVLHVIDYKHGTGVAVKAQNNTQLLCYLLLAWESTLDLTPSVFRATIVQPRHAAVPDVQTEVIQQRELERFRTTCQKAAFSSGEFKTGEHCTWCKSKIVCPAMKALVEEVSQADLEAEVDHQQLVKWFNMTGPIKSLLAQAKEMLEQLLTMGAHIEGVGTVSKVGNRTWKGSDLSVLEELKELGLDDRECLTVHSKLKSPTQIEKLLKERGVNADLEDLYHRPVTGVKIVPVKNQLKDLVDDVLSEYN